MFYYKNWERFCKNLTTLDVVICTASQSLTLRKGECFIVLKHDVETSVPNAYHLANIEHQYGINGSYYVQVYSLNDAENIRLLQEMQSWGHEISYHYDVLDANSGDYEVAEKDFQKYSKQFVDNGFYYNTICLHGNPVKTRVGYHSNARFLSK